MKPKENKALSKKEKENYNLSMSMKKQEENFMNKK